MLLCSAEDVADWFSALGVKSRFDDALAGSTVAITVDEAATRDRMIAKASAIVGAKLGVRFKRSSYAGSNPPTNTPDLVRYIATILSCRYISSRRNLPVSAELTRQCDEVMKWLDEIVAGNMMIPDAPDSFDLTAFVSNFTVDGSYITSKVRRVPRISTGGPPAPESKRVVHNEQGPFSRFD